MAADVLVARWEKGLSGAMDITSPLSPAILEESSLTAGEAAGTAETHANLLLLTQNVLSWGGSVSY